MNEYTKQLASFIENAQLEEQLLPIQKKCLLDTIGCAVAGSQRPEIKNMEDALLEESESGSASVWCTDRRCPLTTALVINGSMNHAVELDDLHKPSKIHAGTVIVPTVLTVGGCHHINGKEALIAMLVGYETMLRIAMGIGVDSHRRRGWHGTATCGNFGAAASAGRILGLNATEQANALGLAGTIAGGLMAYTADGSMSKRYHAGKAAENGYMAAKLAKSGYTGPVYVLEAADGGYAHASSDRYDLDVITDGLGERWHSLEMGHKFYACCGHIHQAIESAITLRDVYSITPSDIASVTVKTYDVSGMKWGFKDPPKNTVEAQFSFPYAVAVALIDGQAFIDQFAQERLSDPSIIELAKKINVETAPQYTARYPKEWCSSVTIQLTDGRTLHHESIGAKGDPIKPLSKEEIETKFRALTKSVLSVDKQNRIINIVDNFEKCDDINIINELLVL